jgi:hypothetical protein
MAAGIQEMPLMYRYAEQSSCQIAVHHSILIEPSDYRRHWCIYHECCPVLPSVPSAFLQLRPNI